jgi:hypothetical protein
VRGEVALAESRWDDALQEFQTTITMIPDDPLLQPKAFDGAARAAAGSGKNTLADEYRKQLKEKFPDWKPSD